MVKALKITIIVYGVMGFLVGLAYIVIPRQFPTFMASFAPIPAYVGNAAAKLGFSYISASVFMIIAALDPIKNSLWVKFTIAFAFLQLAAAILSTALGFITFNQALIDIVLHTLFGIAFIILYSRVTS